MYHKLQHHFLAACGAACPSASADAQQHVWEDILARHQESHRHYHTLHHLQAMMDWLEVAYSPGCTLPPHSVFAVLFHDCVYVPTARDNEEQSAAIACAHLRMLGVPQHVMAYTREFVLATKAHAIPPELASAQPPIYQADLGLFLDADLSILAAPASQYDAYAAAIKLEYAHLDDESYRTGRVAVLRQLMQRPDLFLSEYALASGMKERAVDNMQRELHGLLTG